MTEQNNEIIETFNFISNFQDDIINMTNLKLIFLTQLGIITGKLVTEEDTKADILPTVNGYNQLNLSVPLKRFLEFDENGQQILRKKDFILLKDVQINGPQTSNTPYLVLFLKQVIGVTLGSQND